MRARAPRAALLALLLGAGTSGAASLRGPAAELSLGELVPGSELRASRVLGERPAFVNVGRAPVELSVKAVAPPPGGLTDGCEPWPRAEQVRLSLGRTRLLPGESAELEIVLPGRERRGSEGGQRQFDVLAEGKGADGRTLVMRTRVLFSLDPPTPDAADEGPPWLQASPHGARTGRIPLGRKVSAEEEKALALKLVNAGSEDATVRLSAARPPDGTDAEGFSPAPDPRWLRLETETVTVKAGTVLPVRTALTIPRQSRYAGKRWTFAVLAEAGTGDARVRRTWLLRAETEEEARER